jgi:hypothetical protein
VITGTEDIATTTSVDRADPDGTAITTADPDGTAIITADPVTTMATAGPVTTAEATTAEAAATANQLPAQVMVAARDRHLCALCPGQRYLTPRTA